ncbi:Unconventional myosin-XVB [Allomyces arbusculus]|nr:Unconventional myosin-XVB [Allomyces arbusculus]
MSFAPISPGAWVWCRPDPASTRAVGANVIAVDGATATIVTTTQMSLTLPLDSLRAMSQACMCGVDPLANLPQEEQNEAGWAHSLWVHHSRGQDLVSLDGPSHVLMAPMNAGIVPIPVSLLSGCGLGEPREGANSVALVGTIPLSTVAAVVESFAWLNPSAVQRLTSVLQVLDLLVQVGNEPSAVSIQVADSNHFRVQCAPDLSALDSAGWCFNGLYLLGNPESWTLLRNRPIPPTQPTLAALQAALDGLGLAGLIPHIQAILTACLHIGNVQFQVQDGHAVRIANPDALSAVSSLLALQNPEGSMALFAPVLGQPVAVAEAERTAIVHELIDHLVQYLLLYLNQSVATPGPESRSITIAARRADVAFAHTCFHRKHEPGTPWGTAARTNLWGRVVSGDVYLAAALSAAQDGVVVPTATTKWVFAIPVLTEINELNVDRAAECVAPLVHADVAGVAAQLNTMTVAAPVVATSSHPQPPADAPAPLPMAKSWDAVNEDDGLDEEEQRRERELLEYLERSEQQRQQQVAERMNRQLNENAQILARVGAFPNDLQQLLAVKPHQVDQLSSDPNPVYLSVPVPPVSVSAPRSSLPVMTPHPVLNQAFTTSLVLHERHTIVNYLLSQQLSRQSAGPADDMYSTCLHTHADHPDRWKWVALLSCVLAPSPCYHESIIEMCMQQTGDAALAQWLQNNFGIFAQWPRRYGATHVEAQYAWDRVPLRLNIQWPDQVDIVVECHPTLLVRDVTQTLLTWRQMTDISPVEYTLCLSGLGIEMRLAPDDLFMDLLSLYQTLFEMGKVTIGIQRLYQPPTATLNADAALCHMQLLPRYPDLSTADECFQRAHATGLWAMRFPTMFPVGSTLESGARASARWLVITSFGLVMERLNRNGIDVAWSSRWDDLVVVNSADPSSLTFLVDGQLRTVPCNSAQVMDFMSVWLAQVHCGYAVVTAAFRRDATVVHPGQVVYVVEDRTPWMLVSGGPGLPPTGWVPLSVLEYIVDQAALPAIQEGRWPRRFLVAMRRAAAGNVPDATALVQDLVVAAPEPEPTETIPSAVAALVGPAAPAPAPLPTSVKPGAVAAANAAAAAANAAGGASAPGYGTLTAAIMSGPFPNNAYGTVKLASDAVLGAGAAGGADKANDATAAALNPVHKLTINPLINLRVGDYSMEQYASQYFETKSGSLFGKKKVTLDAKAISYSDSALKKPLTRAAFGDVADTRKAIEMNTMILSFMGDAKLKGVSQLEAAKRMVDAAMSSAALVDEAYCQIIKQLTGHPRPEGVKAGVALLGLLAAFVIPSKDLNMSMCRFLQQVLRANASDQGLGTVVQNAYANMMKSMALGARQLGPSDDEVVALMTQSNLRLKVELPDQVSKTFLIDSYTIASEILVKLEERFDMDFARHEYGLAIDAGARPSTMPLIPVMPPDRLADIITLAERLREKLSAAAGSDAPGGAGAAAMEGRVAPRIVYIRRQWSSAGSVTSRPHRIVKEGEAAPGDGINSIPSLPKNLPPICAPALLDWTFQQLLTRFLVGDIISAAELKLNVLPELVYLMALLGVATAVSDVQHLIPPVVLANLDTPVMVFRSKIQIMMEDWVESHKPSVVAALGATGGNDPGAITKALVNLAKKEFNERMRATFQYFGAFPFKIKSPSDARFANGAVLIVHESSIVILDDKTRKVIMTIEYDELVNDLEFGQDEFVIRTESMVQRRNVRFETVQGFMLADMITAAKDRALASKKTKPAAAPTAAPATAAAPAAQAPHASHASLAPAATMSMQVPMAVPMMQAPMTVPAMAAAPPKPFPDMGMYGGHPQYSQAPQQAYGYYGHGGAPAPMMGTYCAPGAAPMGYPGVGYGTVQGMPMQGQPPMPPPGSQGYNQYYYPPGPGQ